MPIVDHSTANPVEMLPGVIRRTLTDGDRMMLCEIRMNKGAVVPLHTHPHEQTGYLVSGRCRFQIGDEVRELAAGDCWMVPAARSMRPRRSKILCLSTSSLLPGKSTDN